MNLGASEFCRKSWTIFPMKQWCNCVVSLMTHVQCVSAFRQLKQQQIDWRKSWALQHLWPMSFCYQYPKMKSMTCWSNMKMPTLCPSNSTFWIPLCIWYMLCPFFSLSLSHTHTQLPKKTMSNHTVWSACSCHKFNCYWMQVNYYIVVPSSDEYAMLLNAPASLCGVIIGSMPLAALVSAFVYSWWSNFSYKSPLLLSSLILMAGNFMYALALYFNSVWLLLIGRFLCG